MKKGLTSTVHPPQNRENLPPNYRYACNTQGDLTIAAVTDIILDMWLILVQEYVCRHISDIATGVDFKLGQDHHGNRAISGHALIMSESNPIWQQPPLLTSARRH